jgi:NlpC/P60 family
MPAAPPHEGKSPQAQRRAGGGASAAAFLAMARKALGTPYVWGGSAPGGFDCSGLVYWAARAVGIKGIPRTSEAQWGFVDRISQSQLQPGDLVFEQWPGDQAAPGHVAIYTGKGRIEEAPQPGESVHEVAWSPGQVNAAGGRIVGYGRIPGLGGTAAAAAATTTGFLQWPGEITGFFTGAATAVDWLLQPSHWVRIICALAGAWGVGGGVWQLSHAGGSASGGGGMQIIPRPAALPLGILMVGGGGVLLFIAFHNLPPTVDGVGPLLSYLQAQVKGNATGTPAPAAAAATGPDQIM